jgi:hypothetical protein
MLLHAFDTSDLCLFHKLFGIQQELHACGAEAQMQGKVDDLFTRASGSSLDSTWMLLLLDLLAVHPLVVHRVCDGDMANSGLSQEVSGEYVAPFVMVIRRL